MGNHKRRRERHCSLGRGLFGRQFERILSGNGFEGYASEREPSFRGSVVTEFELMAQPSAGEGLEFRWRLHLKQNRCPVNQASGLGLDVPCYAEGGKHEAEKDECAVGGCTQRCSEPPGFALAGQPRRLPPREIAWLGIRLGQACELLEFHFT